MSILGAHRRLRQVQPRNADGQYKGVWSSLVRMWREEGPRGLLRGNGINCLRIVPYRWVPSIHWYCISFGTSAVQFTTYEQLKKVSLHVRLDAENSRVVGAL